MKDNYFPKYTETSGFFFFKSHTTILHVFYCCIFLSTSAFNLLCWLSI